MNAQPGDSLACGDAGALPYYSGLRTIDILGLNDSHIAHLKGSFYDKTDSDYVLSRQPTYLVLLSGTPTTQSFRGRTKASQELYARIADEPLYKLIGEYQFSNNYYLWVYATEADSSS